MAGRYLGFGMGFFLARAVASQAAFAIFTCKNVNCQV